MNTTALKSVMRLTRACFRQAWLVLFCLPAACSSDHPSVTAVAPSLGSARGGDEVVVSGSHFQEGANVSFGGKPARSVKFLSEGELQVLTPASVSGPVSVSVTNPSGDEGGRDNAFVYERLKLAFIQAPAAFLPDLTGLPITDAVIADFDSDGDNDIFLAMRGEPSRVLLNEGHGSFIFRGQNAEPSDAGSKDSADAADADAATGDSGAGDASSKDSAVADSGTSAPSGQGVWTADTVRVVTGDFNQDDSPDLLACNESGKGLRLWINDKTGTFAESKTVLSSQVFDCLDTLTRDFDGDGKLDIAVLSLNSTGGTGLRLLLNRSSADLVAWEELGAKEDIPDAGNPAPVDAALDSAKPDAPTEAGKPDASTDAGTQENKYVLSWPDRMTRISAADLNSDGVPDLVVSSSEPKAQTALRFVSISLGQNKILSFEEMATSVVLTNPVAATGLLDVDSDGDLDLILVGPGQDRLLLNDGKGRFFDDTIASMPVDNSVGSNLSLADMDLDGKVDLVISNMGGINRLYVHGSGTRMQDETPALPLESSQTLTMAPGDIDGDEDLDLIVIDGKAPAVRLFVSTEPAKK